MRRESGLRHSLRWSIEVLGLPLAARFDLATTAPGERVVVSPSVPLALFDEALVDERIEVRIQPTVVDLLLVVLLELLFDR